MITLLRTREVIDAVEPIVGFRPDLRDVENFIARGEIKPLGIVWGDPVFSPRQIGEVAAVLQRNHGPHGGNHDGH